MKKRFLVLGIVFYVGNTLSVPAAQRPVTRPVRPVASPLFTQPVKEFIPVKSEFRQLRIKELPKINGQLNRSDIVVDAGDVSSEVLSYLNADQQKSLNTVIAQLKGNETDSAKTAWQGLVSSFRGGTVPIDLNALMNYVLRESYLEQNKDLYFYAFKVKYLNDKKNELRNHLKELRDIRKGVSTGLAGKIDELISELENNLQTIGDDTQLSMLELQNMMNRQAQLMQMMSNISKTMHDTAMAIIRNLR